MKFNAVGTVTKTPASNPELQPGATAFASFYNFGFIPPIFDNLNGLSKDFAPSVDIYTPHLLDSVVLSPSEYIEKFIHLGDLKLRDWSTDEYEGFHFVIGWRCVLLPGYNHYKAKNEARIPSISVGLTPSNGPKNDDDIFRVSKFEKTETPVYLIYDITFEIECDLYLWYK